MVFCSLCDPFQGYNSYQIVVYQDFLRSAMISASEKYGRKNLRIWLPQPSL